MTNRIMKGVIVNRDNKWEVLSCEIFEQDYHIKPKQSENIYVLQRRGNEYYIIAYPLVCGIFYEGRLCYIDYHPNIIINGQPQINLIPDDAVYESVEDIYKYIEDLNKRMREDPVVTLGWMK